MAIFDLLRPEPGLRVVITGAAAGIGFTIAKAFDEAGARICVCDIDPAAVAAARAASPSIEAVVANVADRDSVDRFIDTAADALGGIDVLVNNAGIAGPTGAIEELAPEDWDRTTSTNLNSQYYVLRRAVPILKRSPSASIIAMSSVAGRLGYPYRTPYASTKWAIVGLVKSLAAELGGDNVRVNAVLPGLVTGPRIDRVIDARAKALGIGYDDMKAEYLKKISLGRMVTEDDVAAMTLFLCSPAARNITGQAISVDGNVAYL